MAGSAPRAVTERVVITGLGVIASNAHGKEAFSRALRECKSGVRFHPHLRDIGMACHVGGIPEGLDELSAKYLTEEELLVANHSTTFAATPIRATGLGGGSWPPCAVPTPICFRRNSRRT